MWRIRRPFYLASLANSLCSSRSQSFCLKSLSHHPTSKRNDSSNIHLSPLVSDERPQLGGNFHIELVDNETWQITSGLSHSWQALNGEVGANPIVGSVQSDQSYNHADDVDEIDNMRIRGNLFYKLDRGSKEFEEYSFEFHRRNKSPKKKDKGSLKLDDNDMETTKKEKRGRCLGIEVENPLNFVSQGKVYAFIGGNDLNGLSDLRNKKVRKPTFNQLTGPYHEPFCLDIFISKASVRACIIHRVTSKVVAVAHSISKDMKFDYDSTRNATSCAAVVSILAQRALADDIHDVFYTPRKGERLEGRLQIVLQSIIDNGVKVKVKLKQRKSYKPTLQSL